MTLPMPVTLRDGRAVVVREIVAPDAQEIVQAFARLSDESRYTRFMISDTCEFAVTVGDDWHAIGLAGRLMEVLIASARERGLHWMEGQILALNTPMRRLAKCLGFSDRRCPDDAALRLMRLNLSQSRAGGDQE